VRLVRIQLEVVPPERLLNAEHLEQVVRREPGRLFERALELSWRQPDQLRDVGDGANRIEPSQDARRHHVRSDSFNLDWPLMQYLSILTGDSTFLDYVPTHSRYLPLLSVRRDVVRDLLIHTLVTEYAFTRLARMKAAVEHGEIWHETTHLTPH
jgi:hypothetical protein